MDEEDDVIMTPIQEKNIEIEEDINKITNEETNKDKFNIIKNHQYIQSTFNLNMNMNKNASDSTSNSNLKKQSRKSIVSKRILCELVKSDITAEEKTTANEISQRLEFFIDLILNKCNNKIHFIQYFMCYIVEINSELIRMIPEYKDLSHNLNLRFIMPAKNLYNFAIEVYFSLHDLYNVRLNKI